MNKKKSSVRFYIVNDDDINNEIKNLLKVLFLFLI